MAIIRLDSLSGLMVSEKTKAKRLKARSKREDFKYIGFGLSKPHRIVKERTRIKLEKFQSWLDGLLVKMK